MNKAPQKRFQETIVFVHHFGGGMRTTLRHLRLVNNLGFDAVRFELAFNSFEARNLLPISADLKIGARHIWMEQIESVLNAIPGKKILYSFSMPSLGALGAIANRHANDITGWVTDGGPFLQLMRASNNLFEHEYHVKNPLLRLAYTGGSYMMFGWGTEVSVPRWLEELPKGFPVLSIRGGKDPLVPVSAINAVFNQTDCLGLEKLFIPDGAHLDGLKKFASVYEPAVKGFLTKIGTSV
ncbi:MAG: hypothetical protein EOP05_22895 [Proteobacteria bacterium]|nr:MAG: hypothetical protein EOP05_22895 [Pseudomonadota bacterium]